MISGGDLNSLLIGPPKKKHFYNLKDLLANPEQGTRWIIHGLIPEGPSVMMIFGPSGKCKTYVSLDIALSCACGLPTWFSGLKIHKTKVLYLVGEGIQSVKERIACWIQQHGIEDNDLSNDFVLSPYNFPIDSPSALNNTLEQLQNEIGNFNFGLVIIDTMNLFMDGDENATVDANRFIHAVKNMSNEYKTCVMIIHHTGVDKDYRSRGSSVFKGALDSEIQVTRKDGKDGIVTITQTKNRNSENVPQIQLKLEIHDIKGMLDEDTGKPRTNAILVPAEVKEQASPFTAEELFLLGAFQKLGGRTTEIDRDTLIAFGKEYWKDEKDSSTIMRELNPKQMRTLGKLLRDGIIIEQSPGTYAITDSRMLDAVAKMNSDISELFNTE